MVKLNTDLIPHRDFHKGFWLQTKESHDAIKNDLKVKKDGFITSIFSKSNSPVSISKNWDQIYRVLKSNL